MRLSISNYRQVVIARNRGASTTEKQVRSRVDSRVGVMGGEMGGPLDEARKHLPSSLILSPVFGASRGA